MGLIVPSEGLAPWPANGPFALDSDGDYQKWRDIKLRDHPADAQDLIVDIADPARPSDAEIAAIADRCRRANMAVYRFAGPPGLEESRAAVHNLAAVFGLRRFESHRSASDDGLVAIEVNNEPKKRGFIPYTTRDIGWHTDGYYNYHGTDRCIWAMVLHCARQAAEGGESAVLDHEIAYIRLRDLDPRYIAALMHPEAMTIPACEDEGGRLSSVALGFAQPLLSPSGPGGHGDVKGPVFAVDPATGAMHMRYTARTRNIVWRADSLTQDALGALTQVLASDPLAFRLRLEPGWGVICNNVPHKRAAFADSGGAGQGRLLWRIRSYDRLKLS